MDETWYDVVNYEGQYQYSNLLTFRSINRTTISNRGRIAHLKGKPLKIWVNNTGYPTISFCKNGRYEKLGVHVFFARVFIPNPENKPVVNHINGNKLDYSLSNLEWATYSEDRSHAYRTGLKKGLFGEDNPNFGKTGALHPMFGRRGKGCGLFGRTGAEHHKSKLVLDTQTGIFYESAKEAAEAKCINAAYLRTQLSGNSRNLTSLMYA